MFDRGDEKAASNLRKHGVSFERATLAFNDPFGLVLEDDRIGYDEARFILIGVVRDRMLTVVYTEKGEPSGSFQHERRSRGSGGGIMNNRKASDPIFDWNKLDAMSEAEKHRAALADPDNPPLTEDDMRRMKRVPRAKVIRRALGLSQEEFSARFRIPLGTLRDWEQGRTEPDQAARAYLTVIARAPDAVVDALGNAA